MRLEFKQQISEKYSNIKFYGNPFGGSRVVPRGWKDGHDEANSRFSQLLRTRLQRLAAGRQA